MRDFLAEKLLASVMDWSAEDVAQERPYLQAMAAFKYDSYGQFRPGMRFIESLALWLNQFTHQEERRLLYAWIRERLVFISASEMNHLVALSFPQIVRPRLVACCARELKLNEKYIAVINRSPEYRSLLRKTLFLGLSDGAQLATFRRYNPEISNEQVWLTYDFTEHKAETMIEELRQDLLGFQPVGQEQVASQIACRFREIFLMDDFSASGLSYIRLEEGEYKGKIPKALGVLAKYESLLDQDELGVTVILYVATEEALDHVRTMLQSYSNNVCHEGIRAGLTIDIQVIQLLDHHQKVDTNNAVVQVLERYFDPAIVDKHYRKGRHDRPYLGFNEGGLSCVLSHNTPNNSFPLLWFNERSKFQGLFPRVSRHKA